MKNLTRIALIAAVYVVLTVVFLPYSFGPVQVRLAECLTVIPYLFPETMWGLFLGCFLANFLGGMGFLDIFIGSLLTLLAGFLTSQVTQAWMAPLPPILINALGVSGYLAYLLQVNYWYSVTWIAVGETIACFGLGYPLLLFLQKRLKERG